MIVVNFNRVLMDYFWDDSEAFRPERFIDDQGKLTIPEQFLPFSFGTSLILFLLKPKEKKANKINISKKKEKLIFQEKRKNKISKKRKIVKKVNELN